MESLMSGIGIVCTFVSTGVAVIECVIHCRDRRRRREAVENDSQTEDIQPAVKSGGCKDLGQYFLDGQGPYGKGRLVLAVICTYVAGHSGITYEDLRKVFPNSLRGLKKPNSFWGCFNLRKDAQKLYRETGYVRHFLNENEIIHLADGCEIAVSSQWGIGNIGLFIERAKELGFKITK